jgi:hypothetical protein
MTDARLAPGVYHWTDSSREARQARKRLRDNFTLGFDKPKASSDSDHRADAEIHPGEYFRCGCGSGPWHITWGLICPNCSGAD